MKWKQFFRIWLMVFLLAPSIWTHNLLMIGMPPPGSPVSPRPLFMPFGGIYSTENFLVQLIRGDFTDALIVFTLTVLPILIYTFFISWLIYYCLQKFLRQDLENFHLNWKYLLPIWLTVFLLAPSIWPHSPILDESTQPPLRHFGVVHYANELREQLAVFGKFEFPMIPTTIHPILVILAYSFVLSSIIYYCFWKVRHPRLSAN